MLTRSAPMEATLLNKLDRLPVTPRRGVRLRRFDFANYPVLRMPKAKRIQGQIGN